MLRCKRIVQNCVLAFAPTKLLGAREDSAFHSASNARLCCAAMRNCDQRDSLPLRQLEARAVLRHRIAEMIGPVASSAITTRCNCDRDPHPATDRVGTTICSEMVTARASCGAARLPLTIGPAACSASRVTIEAEPVAVTRRKADADVSATLTQIKVAEIPVGIVAARANRVPSALGR
jgi:hypothetical protein